MARAEVESARVIYNPFPLSREAVDAGFAPFFKPSNERAGAFILGMTQLSVDDPLLYEYVLNSSDFYDPAKQTRIGYQNGALAMIHTAKASAEEGSGVLRKMTEPILREYEGLPSPLSTDPAHGRLYAPTYEDAFVHEEWSLVDKLIELSSTMSDEQLEDIYDGVTDMYALFRFARKRF